MELAKAIRKARRTYIIGNGGSATNATHIANDLISVGIKAHSLTADIATVTAIGNDYGFQFIFSRQLQVFGEPEDLLIALSGSGKSPNILIAVKTAKAIGMSVITIYGAERGEDMQEAEEAQLSLGHAAMLWLKANP